MKTVTESQGVTRAVEADLRLFNRKIPCVISPHPLFDNYSEPVSRAEAIVRLNLCPADRFMLFFGFIREYKGLDLLLHAMADPAVMSLGVKLIVAGEFYENEKPYFDLMHKFNLGSRIILQTHFINKEEVTRLLSRFACCTAVPVSHTERSDPGCISL